MLSRLPASVTIAYIEFNGIIYELNSVEQRILYGMVKQSIEL